MTQSDRFQCLGNVQLWPNRSKRATCIACYSSQSWKIWTFQWLSHVAVGYSQSACTMENEQHFPACDVIEVTFNGRQLVQESTHLGHATKGLATLGRLVWCEHRFRVRHYYFNVKRHKVARITSLYWLWYTWGYLPAWGPSAIAWVDCPVVTPVVNVSQHSSLSKQAYRTESRERDLCNQHFCFINLRRPRLIVLQIKQVMHHDPYHCYATGYMWFRKSIWFSLGCICRKSTSTLLPCPSISCSLCCPSNVWLQDCLRSYAATDCHLISRENIPSQ